MGKFVDQLRQILIGHQLDLFVNVIEVNEKQHCLRLQDAISNGVLCDEDVAELLENLVTDAS